VNDRDFKNAKWQIWHYWMLETTSWLLFVYRTMRLLSTNNAAKTPRLTLFPESWRWTPVRIRQHAAHHVAHIRSGYLLPGVRGERLSRDTSAPQPRRRGPRHIRFGNVVFCGFLVKKKSRWKTLKIYGISAPVFQNSWKRSFFGPRARLMWNVLWVIFSWGLYCFDKSSLAFPRKSYSFCESL